MIREFNEKESEIFSMLALKNPERIKQLLESFDISYTNENCQTLLHLACLEGNKELVQEIIEHLRKIGQLVQGINIDDNKHWSPIFYAIDASESGFPEIVDLLLKNGADSSKQDIKGITPLHLSAYKGQDDNVDLLLKHKGDVNMKDSIGRVPLNYAIMEGQVNVIQALLQGKTNLRTVDYNGDSLLHYAISSKGNSFLYASLLLEHGIDVNMKNNEGDTPLILCVRKAAKENVRLIHKLIDCKADCTLVNNFGESFYSLLAQEAIRENFLEKNKTTGDASSPVIRHSLKAIFYFVLFPVLLLLISLKLV